MARHRGPTEKISRRFGVPLFGPSKALERRAYGPGQHGARNVRKKRSDFSVALGEKQKLRLQYGIMERQFRGYYEEASRRKGVTGHIMLQLLETRLDNVCFRMGFGNTRRAARQFVGHGHVTVNGRRVNIASYLVKDGDEIEIRDRSKQMTVVMEATQSAERDVPDYIQVDHHAMKGTFVRTPLLADVPYPVKMEPNLVVEYYSR